MGMILAKLFPFFFQYHMLVVHVGIASSSLTKGVSSRFDVHALKSPIKQISVFSYSVNNPVKSISIIAK